MGLSTQTPGIAGEERMEELRSRLEQAKGKTRLALSLDPGASATTEKHQGSGSNGAYAAPPSIGDLTIAEIRSRLTALGENTQTPGLSGDERRAELMKRLVGAICGSDDDSEGSGSGEEGPKRVKTPLVISMRNPAVGVLRPSSREKVLAAAAATATAPPPKFVPPPPKAPPAKASPAKVQVAPSVQEIYNSDDEYEDVQPVSQSEINELKKEITRISNKRAMLIAARLSGSGQDKDLKEAEKNVSQADAELARISVQKQRSKVLGAEKASSLLVESGASMPIARLQGELEQLRSISKEEIKMLRQRIREEADQHADYGMEVQNAIQAKLNEALLSKGRTRRKISDIKSSIKTTTLSTGRPTSSEQKAKKDASTGGFSGRNPNATLSNQTQPVPKPTSATSKARTQSPAAQASRPASKPKAKPTAPAAQSSAGRFDKQVARMEVESEKALNGLDDLLAQMEHEDALKLQHDNNDLDNDMLVVNTAHLRNKAIVPKAGVGMAGLPPSRPTVLIARDVPAPAPAHAHASVALVAATEDFEEDEEQEEEEDEEDEDEEIHAPSSESPLKLKVAAGSLSSRVAPPEGRAPKEAQLLPSPMKHKQPSEFATGIALREGSHFDNQSDDDEDDEGQASSPPKFDNDNDNDNDSNNNDRPDTAATNVTTSRPTTAASAYGLEDEDEELSSLLRKYPQQATGDDEEEEDEEEESDLEIVNSRPGSKGYVLRTKTPPEASKNSNSPAPQVPATIPGYPSNAFDFERAEDFVTVKSEKPVWKSVKSAALQIDAPSQDPPAKQSPERKQDVASKHSKQPSPPPTTTIHSTQVSSSPAAAATTAAAIVTASSGPFSSSGSPTSKSGKPLSLPVIPNVPAIIRTSPMSKSTLDQGVAGTDKTQNSKTAAKGKYSNEDGDGGGGEDDDDDEVNDDGNNEQLNALRRHARVLEKLNDLSQADKMYRRCLDIDPTDVKSLQSYAIFLHQKKGDLSLAESYFSRAIQVCLPGFLDSDGHGKVDSVGNELTPTRKAALNVKAPAQLPQGRSPEAGAGGLRIEHVARLLIKYGDFAARAKGDSSNAIRAYRKAVFLHPTNADALTTLAHFLGEEGDPENYNEAIDLFAKALRVNPHNAVYALKYARLLKKAGQLGKADLMYQVARTNSKGNHKLEASAICNYATFVCRQRKNVSLAQTLFLEGLSKYSDHKGLLKNYAILLKANPSYGDASGVQSPKKSPKRNKENRENDPERKNIGVGQEKDKESGEVSTPPVSTKRAVAKVHARMLLTTSGAPVDASEMVGDAETPSKLKDDYNASLENVRKSVKSFQQEELAASDAKAKKESKEKSLAELSSEFNSFFDSTNNNSVSGDGDMSEKVEAAQAGIYRDTDNLSDDDADDDDDDDEEEEEDDSDLYSNKRF